MKRNQVNANLIYASRDTSDGKKHWVEGGVSDPRKNYVESEYSCVVNDLGAQGSDRFLPTLDQNGFAMTSLATKETSFNDESSIVAQYYSEIETFLREYLQATRIVIFDHTVRRPNSARGPLSRTHVDQTTKAAIARVKRHVPEAADDLMQKRFQIINVWRPIEHPAWNSPLALCDYQSITEKDMIITDRIDFSKPDAPPGETYSVAYNPAHTWYYHRNLDPGKVILIKCFDSKHNIATYCPHTAFTDSTSEEGKPKRQSIEVRALVFYD